MRILLLILTLFPVFSNAQSIQRCPGPVFVKNGIPDLEVTPILTVYNKDTFNRLDAQGLMQGNGITLDISGTWDNGILKGFCVGEFINSRASGNWKCIDFNSNDTATGAYIDGARQGLWTYSNGLRKLTIAFLNGVITGELKIYYNTGELMYTGEIQQYGTHVKLKHFLKSGLQPDIITVESSEAWLLSN